MKKLIAILGLILITALGFGQTLAPKGIKIGKVKTGTSVITVDSLIQVGTKSVRLYKGATILYPVPDSTAGDRAFVTDHRADLIEASVLTKPARDSVVMKSNIYYVDQTFGSDDSTGLTEVRAWKTIAKVNASTFIPGSTILFKRGCTWREQLTPPSSGTADRRITFSSYGYGAPPIITGGDIIGGGKWVNNYGAYPKVWGTVSPNSVTTRAMVAIDDSLYTQVATFAAVNSDRKYFIKTASTPDSIFVWSATDPDNRTAEVSAREYGLYLTKSFITVRGLDFRMAGNKGFVGSGLNATLNGYAIIENCNFYRNRLVGAGFYDGYCHSIVRYCTATYNGNNYLSWGTQGSGPGTGGVGSNYNTFTYNYSAYAIHDYVVAGQYSDGTAYQLFNSTGCIVEHCISFHDNSGGYLDPYTNGNLTMTFRYNQIYEANAISSSSGIGVSNSAAGTVLDIYYNLVVNCGHLSGGYAAIMLPSTNGGAIHFYNNTVYNDNVVLINSQLFAVHGTNITLKNNIFRFKTSVDSYYMIWSFSSTGFPVSDYNQFSKSTVYAYVQYNGGAPYTTLTAWQSASSQDAHSATTDPLFTTEGTDFTLQSTSPAINTGTVISEIPQVDMLGNPIEGTPDKGCYEHQTAIFSQQYEPEYQAKEFKEPVKFDKGIILSPSDTTIIADPGTIVYQTSDKHWYGCKQTSTSYKRWFQLDN